MENGRGSSSNLSTAASQDANSKKKKKSSKNNGKKAKSKGSTSHHSKRSPVSGDANVITGMSGEAERAPDLTESASPAEAASGATGDPTNAKRDHSKPRSRSGSRSRFSGFFKRKRRSKSETDLGQMMMPEMETGQEGQSSTDVSGGTDSKTTSLKKVSPYHAYDSRVQPRDRLMNMTVRDAVKEQRLRRVHSSSRSPQRRKSTRRDDGEVTRPTSQQGSTTECAMLESKAGDLERPASRSSTLPRLSKASILSSDPERSAFHKYCSNPELKKHAAGASSSGSRNDVSLVSSSKDGNVSSTSPGLENFTGRESPVEYLAAERDYEADNLVLGYASKLDKSPEVDPLNDGEDTKTLVNVSISSQEEDQVDCASRPTVFLPRIVEAQRKASLTKFLELRQQPPPSSARYHHGVSPTADHSQSKDLSLLSSVAAHGPSAERGSGSNEKASSVSPLNVIREKEHYNTTSVSSALTAPKVSLNGASMETLSSSPAPTVRRPTSIMLEDSAVESSSLSSSPQINSMTSSFRSSDQGYAESGDEDDDSSDDNSAFSTPPEDAGLVHSNQLTASMLRKLLDPIKETQRSLLANVADVASAKSDSDHPQKVKGEKVKEGSSLNQRYIPHGVRRSKSDVTTRRKPYRRYFRNTSSPPVKSRLAISETCSQVGTPTESLAGDALSAVSACTLTSSTGSFVGLGERANGLGASEHTFLPAMSPASQQRYRRSFTPNRSRLALQGAATPPTTLPITIKSKSIIPSELPVNSNVAPAAAPQKDETVKSPLNPRKGILKPAVKEQISINAAERPTPYITNETRSESEKPQMNRKHEEVSRELPTSYPDIEIILGTPAESKTTSTPVEEESNSHKALTTSPVQEPSPSPKIISDVKPSYVRLASIEEKKPLPLFPIFHGLEVGRHREPTVSNYSLAEYIQEQSLGVYSQRQVALSDDSPQGKIPKEAKGWRKSFKRKSKNNRKDQKKEKKEDPVIGYSLKAVDASNFKVMVDKQVQTSAWLINSMAAKKTPKLKKKSSHSVRKSKRRDSVVSDTFVPAEHPKYKEAYQRSSLRDLRKPAEVEPVGIVAFTSKAAASPTKTGGILRPQPIVASSSSAADSIKHEQEAAEISHKPKKLSLTAVILLKNRLARFREKKRKEKSSPSAEVVTCDLPSDTMVTIENEINLSKLEISKETDIIDDVFEPEFSLDYTKRRIRFEPLPNEPMQSEEPLPPLLPSSSRRLRQRRESTLRARRRKCIQYCKKFVAFLFSHIGLCSLVVAYTILGGFIFQALEQNADGTVRNTITDTMTWATETHHWMMKLFGQPGPFLLYTAKSFLEKINTRGP
ncbi:hypothetical protein Btru_002241 [Bulinus truncatus]|nr:hypothetical protein Btru_002241 [Bulinus truncatus]